MSFQIITVGFLQCDLQFPRCANCCKRAIKCQFEDEDSPQTLNSFALQEPCTHTRIASLPVSSTATASSLRSKDFELFHHFFNITSSSIASTPREQYVWRYIVPSFAREHEYLWYNLLALSAVHNAHIRPLDQQRYHQRLATDYQSRAATKFQTVRTITRDNCYAICASAGIAILTEWARTLYTELADPIGLGPIQELLEKIILIRKVTPLWTCAQIHLEEEHVPQVQLALGDHTAEDRLPEKICIALRNLELLLDLIPKSSQERTSYIVAIQSLSWSTKDMLVQPRSLGQPLYWSTAIDDQFIDLLKLKEPLALIVLAHYCNLLHHASTQWCLDGSAKIVFKAIRESIGDPWLPLLDCVEEAMKIDPLLRPRVVTEFTVNSDTINREEATDHDSNSQIDQQLFEEKKPPARAQRKRNAEGYRAYPNQASLASLTGALLGVNPWRLGGQLQQF
ncbi:hypothetical protein MMC10_007841 [Thelotrema lepadinum]|nr:hypothetical protein [Thelotrema lepadinum]